MPPVDWFWYHFLVGYKDTESSPPSSRFSEEIKDYISADRFYGDEHENFLSILEKDLKKPQTIQEGLSDRARYPDFINSLLTEAVVSGLFRSYDNHMNVFKREKDKWHRKSLDEISHRNPFLRLDVKIQLIERRELEF